MIVNMTLDGQVAVVTGGSCGIGRQIAIALANKGAKVAVTARTQSQLDETVSLVTDAGGTCIAVEMDVTNTQQVTAGMATIVDELGAISLLVNNAGLGGAGRPLWEIDSDAWWRTIEVNVRGVFLCAHTVLPQMIKQGHGRIINLGSNAGLHPNPMTTAYAVSKAALLRLTDSLAESSEPYNVQVFAISPGLVSTDMTKDVPTFKDFPASKWTPIERAGELCVYLASGKADKLTGRYIHASEDVEELVVRAEEIIENNLLTLRLNR